MGFRHLVLILFLLPRLGFGAPDVLTQVGQVRALTPEKARARIPVEIEGVVIYFDATTGHAFIHDETGSVFFRPGIAGTPGSVTAAIGDHVRLRGITWAGEFSPSIAGPSSEDAPAPVELIPLGAGKLPEPLPVPFDQLKTGRWHDQWVSIHGTVREIDAAPGLGPRRISLLLSGPDGRSIQALGNNLDIGNPVMEVNQEIELRGIVAGGGDALGRLQDAHLLIGDASWIQSDSASTTAAFDQAPTALSDLRRYLPPEIRAHRIRVDGSISLVVPNQGFFLTDGHLGTWIETTQQQSFHLGDIVTAVGYVSGNTLTDGIIKVLAQGPPPAPRVTQPSELNDATLQGALVTLEGTLRDLRNLSTGSDFHIEDRNGHTIAATAPPLSAPPESGARILVTGVADQGQLRLRNSRDLTILSGPPWLTPSRQIALLIGAAFVVTAIILGLTSLKIQVARQTRLIQAQLVHRTLVEERQRMGRELHDSLEQYLAGLHLQLGALKDRTADSPASVRELAAGAVRMLDHCREEARRSVFELRTQTFQREGLAAALVQFVEEIHPSAPPTVTVEITGVTRPLPSATEFNLLRCAQEATANALKHAQAQSIQLHLHYLPDRIRLSIHDDGQGFDPAAPYASQRPHFGLLHLKERSDRMHAELAVDSAPGLGTTVTLHLPL
ncbi:signal transduction histidine kinase [Haloferula luteola]|uniref:Signal transduction histidine kinase n=1 Tax=Haloferula luteola TaxID=595692 RepID=A0A840VH06_9BACT|nr:sensor histidine kinase [Haloferula luteola]MBB5352061.1 signal transduction histidine kinase [Haloferula luteola]